MAHTTVNFDAFDWSHWPSCEQFPDPDGQRSCLRAKQRRRVLLPGPKFYNAENHRGITNGSADGGAVQPPKQQRPTAVHPGTGTGFDAFDWSRWPDCSQFSDPSGRLACVRAKRGHADPVGAIPSAASDGRDRRLRRKPPPPPPATTEDDGPVGGSSGGTFVKRDCSHVGGGMNLQTCVGVWDGRRPAFVKYVALGTGNHIDGEREVRMMKLARSNDVPRPNVVQFLGETDRTADRVGIVMELLDGPTLRQWGEQSPSEIGQLGRYVPQIRAGLRFLHRDRRIVHCDIKPDNIMLRRNADGSVGAVITDLGFAVRCNERIVFGFPGFMLRGIDQPAVRQQDEFALTATVYTMLRRDAWAQLQTAGPERPAAHRATVYAAVDRSFADHTVVRDLISNRFLAPLSAFLSVPDTFMRSE